MFYVKSNMEKIIITHQEPIEGIKVWILLGYLSNILLYPSKYCNYTSKNKFHPFMDNFYNSLLTKNIIEHKRCKIQF